MTAEYRKRAKSGWNRDKEISNRKERIYESKIEKAAENELSADIEDLMIRSECNEEMNKQMGGTEEVDNVTKVSKKPKQDKDVTRFLSRMRWIFKLCKGDIEYFIKPRQGNEWIRDYYQKYYQDYKKGLPELVALSKRENLPAKVRRQVKELMVLFGIET